MVIFTTTDVKTLACGIIPSGTFLTVQGRNKIDDAWIVYYKNVCTAILDSECEVIVM